MIIALAGRRVDAENAEEARFPLSNVEIVRTRVRAMLEAENATILVSSAACGADLIALSEAGALGIRRRVVLPFETSHFRDTSVLDRPGVWGPLYDRVINQVAESGDLVLAVTAFHEQPYDAASRTILDEALAFSTRFQQRAKAVLVWDRIPRGREDLTGKFGVEARKRGIPVVEIGTL